jgi:hypothetical protein
MFGKNLLKIGGKNALKISQLGASMVILGGVVSAADIVLTLTTDNETLNQINKIIEERETERKEME